MQGIFHIHSNRPIAKQTYELILRGETGAITAPGQFVNLLIDGFYLRRPISVCDWSAGELRLIYKVVGAGTEALSRMERGQMLDVLLGLGNGYDTSCSGQAPLLIGGGVGVPPLYGLAKRLIAEGKKPHAILGFGSADEVFYAQEFSQLGCQVSVCTIDGSAGVRGMVTDLVAARMQNYTYFYTCGPEPMLKALSDVCKGDGQLSFERRMGCGFGACMGCSCQTKYGSKRICKEGPVLKKEEVIW